MREIIGQMRLTELVHNRDLFAEKVKENAMQDMARMGLQIINLTIQNFSDKENVIQNLGVDNITQIQKMLKLLEQIPKEMLRLLKLLLQKLQTKQILILKQRLFNKILIML